MTREELSRLQTYLRKQFRLDTIEVRGRPKKDDSAEVYIDGDFIGVLFRDDEDEDLSYQFQMAILEMDLDDMSGSST